MSSFKFLWYNWLSFSTKIELQKLKMLRDSAKYNELFDFLGKFVNKQKINEIKRKRINEKCFCYFLYRTQGGLKRHLSWR